MLLSEAIRLGCTLTPEDPWRWDGCSVGAALAAVGVARKTLNPHTCEMADLWPWTQTLKVPHPDSLTYTPTVATAISYLTQKRGRLWVADWIESLEREYGIVDEAPASAAEVNEEVRV